MRRKLLAALVLLQVGCVGPGTEPPASLRLTALSPQAEAVSAAGFASRPAAEPAAVGFAPVDLEPRVDEPTEEIAPESSAIATIGGALAQGRGGRRNSVRQAQGSAPLVPPAPVDRLTLEEVIGSVYQTFPLLEASYFARNIAAGEQLAASGEFDLKLKGGIETKPAGFYETYRNDIGLVQPLYTGGEAFAGYRIGRGSFEPWYKERQTNTGGELKTGLLLPLCRDCNIDLRRAELWKADVQRQLAEPEIQAQLITFVLDASYVYWSWVSAGAKVGIAERVLSLAEERTEGIRLQVEVGRIKPPNLRDNLRLIAERRGKLADAERKLMQSAVKLSLFYRDANGEPIIVEDAAVPDFPEIEPTNPDNVTLDAQRAVMQRPELAIYSFLQRQLDIDYAQARNEYLPIVDGMLAASQDMGAPTSKRDDKSQFEFEAGIFVELPVQRRKARGKMQAISAKVAQLNAKRRMTEDKIVSEVQSAYAALIAAEEQVRQAREAVGHAEYLAEVERESLREGQSDVLKVTLREQYAVEAAEKAIDALLLCFLTRAEYRAALAIDRP